MSGEDAAAAPAETPERPNCEEQGAGWEWCASASCLCRLREAAGLPVALKRQDWEAIAQFDLLTPEACAKKDQEGRLPLHRAAACNPNLAVTPLGPENSRAVWLGFSRNSSFHLPST